MDEVVEGDSDPHDPAHMPRRERPALVDRQKHAAHHHGDDGDPPSVGQVEAHVQVRGDSTGPGSRDPDVLSDPEGSARSAGVGGCSRV